MKGHENLLRVSFLHPCHFYVLCMDVRRSESSLYIEVAFLFLCPGINLKKIKKCLGAVINI